MSAYYYIILVFGYIAPAIGVFALCRNARTDFWLRSLIGATLAVFLLHLYAVFQNGSFGFDFRIFRNAGCDVWAGVDPQAPARFSEHPFLNPPTAFPLFAAFAMLPFRASLAVWTMLNVILTLALPALSGFALKSQRLLDTSGARLETTPLAVSPQTFAGLATCLIFSEASVKGLLLGQLSVFTAVALLLALLLQGRNRPIWAGVCLFLATVKIATMLPFLLLFLRRTDRSTWVTLAALVIGACLLTGRPGELPARFAVLTHRIADLAAPGNVNDYSFQGTRHESVISFEHLFYRLGMRNRDLIRCAQALALLSVGAWVAWLVFPGRLPRSDAACLVCLFSMLFLYHRDYDTVILALPLVHFAGRLRATTGQRRRLYAACGLIMMAVLYANSGRLRSLTEWSLHREPWGRLVQAAILPYVLWLILLAMVMLVRARRSEARGDAEAHGLVTNFGTDHQRPSIPSPDFCDS